MASSIFISADATLSYSTATGGGSALTTGTCTYAIKDSTGATVAGGTGTLSHTSAGTYTGTIESTITALLSQKQFYFIEITFAQSPYNDFRRIQYLADYRGES
jgi:hypothetical protein